ncbi:MAG: alpha-ketoglutarate decarboxylase [Eudoraea sp.]|nr:alpha-ketoglutarate decarboxylase [Eudoraea sp.]
MRNSKLLFILLLFPLLGAAQNQGNSDFWQRVNFGGGVGLNFGSNSFNMALSPSAIYRASDIYSVGTGLTFSYSKFDEAELTAYGISFLNYVNPIPQIQLSAEYDQMRINRNFENVLNADDNYWLPALYLGVGYGSRNFIVGVRYDVLFDDGRSIYADPWSPFVRVYF